MSRKLAQEEVVDYLLSHEIEDRTEGKAVWIGRMSLGESPIAGCDLDELMGHLRHLEDVGYIELGQHFPFPYDDDGLSTHLVILHDSFFANFKTSR